MQSIDKAVAAGAALSPLVVNLFTNDLTTPVLGVGLTTVAGAALGTFAAIAYDEQLKPRGRLIVLAPATVIMGCMLVGVVPRWLGWGWSSDGVEGALAGLAAFACYHLLPEAMKRSRELVRNFHLADFIPGAKRRNAATTAKRDNGHPPPPANEESDR